MAAALPPPPRPLVAELLALVKPCESMEGRAGEYGLATTTPAAAAAAAAKGLEMAVAAAAAEATAPAPPSLPPLSGELEGTERGGGEDGIRTERRRRTGWLVCGCGEEKAGESEGTSDEEAALSASVVVGSIDRPGSAPTAAAAAPEEKEEREEGKMAPLPPLLSGNLLEAAAAAEAAEEDEDAASENEATHRASPSAACQAAGAPVVAVDARLVAAAASSRTLLGPETGMQPPAAGAAADPLASLVLAF